MHSIEGNSAASLEPAEGDLITLILGQTTCKSEKKFSFDIVNWINFNVNYGRPLVQPRFPSGASFSVGSSIEMLVNIIRMKKHQKRGKGFRKMH